MPLANAARRGASSTSTRATSSPRRPKAYPIVGISYLLFYGQNNGVHVSDKQKLIKYIASTSANKVVQKLEYVPLSSSIHTAILNALAGNSGSQPACLQ